MTVIVLTSGSSWTVPSDWNNSANTIEVWGGGAGGSSNNFGTKKGAGGGGAYTSISNLPLTPGASIAYVLGAAGLGETASANATQGGDTWFNGATLAASSCGAKGGAICASGNNGGLGGAAASGIPATGSTRNSGGNGGNGNAAASGSGGGGAAGSSGNGVAGTIATAGNTSGTAGGAGDNGSGGSGGSGAGSSGTPTGAAGGANQLGGGGGQGGYAGTGATNGGTGGAGGFPGGGGGSGGTNATNGTLGGAGAGGQIVITYTPSSSFVWSQLSQDALPLQLNNGLNLSFGSFQPILDGASNTPSSWMTKNSADRIAVSRQTQPALPYTPYIPPVVPPVLTAWLPRQQEKVLRLSTTGGSQNVGAAPYSIRVVILNWSVSATQGINPLVAQQPTNIINPIIITSIPLVLGWRNDANFNPAQIKNPQFIAPAFVPVVQPALIIGWRNDANYQIFPKYLQNISGAVAPIFVSTAPIYAWQNLFVRVSQGNKPQNFGGSVQPIAPVAASAPLGGWAQTIVRTIDKKPTQQTSGAASYQYTAQPVNLSNWFVPVSWLTPKKTLLQHTQSVAPLVLKIISGSMAVTESVDMMSGIGYEFVIAFASISTSLKYKPTASDNSSDQPNVSTSLLYTAIITDTGVKGASVTNSLAFKATLSEDVA